MQNHSEYRPVTTEKPKVRNQTATVRGLRLKTATKQQAAAPAVTISGNESNHARLIVSACKVKQAPNVRSSLGNTLTQRTQRNTHSESFYEQLSSLNNVQDQMSRTLN